MNATKPHNTLTWSLLPGSSAKSSFGNAYTLAAAGTIPEMSLQRRARLLFYGTTRHSTALSGSSRMSITSKPTELVLVGGDAMTAKQGFGK